MKVCRSCAHTPLPYLVIIVFSSLLSFLTWLSLRSSGVSPTEHLMSTGLAFLVAAGIAGAYVLNCLNRHCNHHHHDHLD